MADDPAGDARAFVQEHFPQAVWAVVTGSVLGAERTAGSDLDIVVVLPDGDPQAPHRDASRFAGWPVEVFVHDEATLDHYLAMELPGRRPILHRMLATGIAVHGDPGDRPGRCAQVLAAGPGTLPDAEVAWLRYALSDEIDDLVHATDPGERDVIAATAWFTVAQTALRLRGHWVGRSKWLLRELRDLDQDLAQRWLAARGVPEAIVALAGEVLRPVGGALFEGYRVAGERPPGGSVGGVG
jgi:hypothetical protein